MTIGEVPAVLVPVDERIIEVADSLLQSIVQLHSVVGLEVIHIRIMRRGHGRGTDGVVQFGPLINNPH